MYNDNQGRICLMTLIVKSDLKRYMYKIWLCNWMMGVKAYTHGLELNFCIKLYFKIWDLNFIKALWNGNEIWWKHVSLNWKCRFRFWDDGYKPMWMLALIWFFKIIWILFEGFKSYETTWRRVDWDWYYMRWYYNDWKASACWNGKEWICQEFEISFYIWMEIAVY